MKHDMLFWLGLFLLSTMPLTAQVKYEKESRIKSPEVPAAARQFLDALQPQKKVRWYFEQNFKANSIEAKVKYEGKRYSIEFDTAGNLQDLEIQLSRDAIPAATRQQMQTALDSLYTKAKICKIQVQYTGDRATLLALAQQQAPPAAYTTRYEVVAKGKKAGKWKLYEITFTQNGEITHVAEIIFRNTDNLAF